MTPIVSSKRQSVPKVLPDDGTPRDTPSVESGSVVLVDGHVHLHEVFDVATFLSNAAANFREWTRRLGLPKAVHGCLLLAESSGVDRYAELRRGIPGGFGPWTVHPTDEDCSLIARTADGEPSLALIAGRQIVTKERLEVLALGCSRHFDDGEPLNEIVASVLACDALCVVPWGFGKWTGRRGAVVRGLLDSVFADRIFLGDNGGRLGIGMRPSLFKVAEKRGVRILPGTDPLPFRFQVNKAGGYGFVLQGSFDERAPARCIKALLHTGAPQPRIFGRLENWLQFARYQVRMQLRKRRDR